MSYQMTGTIDIGNGRIIINNLSEVEYTESWEELVNSGSLILPLNINFRDDETGAIIKNVYGELIKVGDPIKISWGYDFNNETICVGYITNINPSLPVQIEFESISYLLKKIQVPVKSFNQISLKEMCDFLNGVISKKYPDLKLIPNMLLEDLGKYSIENFVNVAQVLDDLRKHYGCESYVRDGVINVGVPYVENLKDVPVFKFGQNIINSEDLKFRKANDYKCKIKAVSIIRDGKKRKKIESVVGDIDSESLKTLHFYNITNVNDLKKMAENEIKKYKFDGLSGSFESFAIPHVKHGDFIEVVNDQSPDLNCKVLVKKVTYTFSAGSSSIRQKIFLDRISI